MKENEISEYLKTYLKDFIINYQFFNLKIKMMLLMNLQNYLKLKIKQIQQEEDQK